MPPTPPDWSKIKSFVTDTAWPFIDEFIDEFIEDDVLAMAGGLAYYTIFALPAVMLLFLVITGFVFEPAQADELARAQLERLIGVAGASELLEIADRVHKEPDTGIWSLFGLGALFFGASAAFVQLQISLNRAWEVRPDPERSTIKVFLTKRLLSFVMLTTFAFILAVGLVVNAVLSGLGAEIAALFGVKFNPIVYRVIYTVIDLSISVSIIAAVFKVLPDAKISWRDVAIGAGITGVMFTLGRWAISAYLGGGATTSAFGAAASLAIVMIWAYYSSVIVLGGAELTKLIVKYRGKSIEPTDKAVRVIEQIRRIDSETA